jgi:predicted nucleotidyltransferase
MLAYGADTWHSVIMKVGSAGGRARASRLSHGKRREIAKRAALARWRDPKKILHDKNVFADFCRRYGLKSISAFGSVLTDDFDKKSDVDILYVNGQTPLDYSKFFDAVDELEDIFGRHVDFINMDVVQNQMNEIRRHSILSNMRVIHEEKEAINAISVKETRKPQPEEAAMADFCRRHHVKKISLFGSVITDRFKPDSDVDVLLEFEEGSSRSILSMMSDLSNLFAGHDVDFVVRRDIEQSASTLKKREILDSSVEIYAAS